MLEFWILNAGKGDSIVIKYTDEASSTTSFGLIDSNLNQGETTPKALKKLRELNATELSFIALTHPHTDHFLGMSQIMEAIPFRDFISFPIKIEDLKRFGAQLKKTASHESKEIRVGSVELMKIMAKAKTSRQGGEWYTPTGPNSQIYPAGFTGLDIFVILPLPKEKGAFFQYIESNDPENKLLSGIHPNIISLGITIKYAGKTIVFGGDSTKKNWEDHQKQLAKGGVSNLGADIFKIPHHGSTYDNNKDIFNYVYGENEENIALISAIGGNHHPHDDVISLIEDNKTKPYCTNLAKICGAKNVIAFRKHEQLSNELNSFITKNATNTKEETQPCQGDIHVIIDRSGKIEVQPEFNKPCWYRENPITQLLL